jgi:uncharacterized protein YbbC (DUF1343 family)
MKCIVGLEVLRHSPQLAQNWGRCGLLCNQASVTSDFVPAWEVLKNSIGNRFTAMFGPQHGFYGTKQDNMIETDHSKYASFGIPVFSLYSETREPTEHMFSKLDTLIIDLQIVGCRIYTWKATIAACMRAAKKYHKKIVILDRPNPLGGEICEGRTLDLDCTSFVGEYPIPMRHALTTAEAAIFFNQYIECDLSYVKMENWNPSHYWHDLGRHWVLTSPNLPTIDPVYSYPGTVIFEGTNISEGRGTGLPFQFIGAPYISSSEKFIDTVLNYLGGESPGVFLRPCQFEPTSQKWMGRTCSGLQIHVNDRRLVRSLNLSLAIVRSAFELSMSEFKWKDPPYEYDYKSLPINLIYGSKQTSEKFTAKTFSLTDPFWHFGIDDYIDKATKILIYDRKLSGPA